nr:unnamed protein product [Spirometra erinaceieuropaei]
MYPVNLVLPNGATIRIRFKEPRHLLQIPINLDECSEEERQRRLLRRKPRTRLMLQEENVPLWRSYLLGHEASYVPVGRLYKSSSYFDINGRCSFLDALPCGIVEELPFNTYLSKNGRCRTPKTFAGLGGNRGCCRKGERPALKTRKRRRHSRLRITVYVKQRVLHGIIDKLAAINGSDEGHQAIIPSSTVIYDERGYDPTASGAFVFPPADRSHRRYNPLTQEWVVVSPNRLQRPWSGAVEKVSGDQSNKSANPGDQCKPNPLAPGATRPGGVVNPNYTATYTFKNDFPALSPRLGDKVDDETVEADVARSAHPLFAWAPATGECQVMCFHPKPDLTLALMEEEDIAKVIVEWQRITQDCVKRGFQWVQIFENRGEIMGCSNPHPHCQIWASDFLPSQAIRRELSQRDFYSRSSGQVLLMDYLEQELQFMARCKESGEQNHRIVTLNEDWVCLVPWWAVWPFETMVLPRRRQIYRLDDLQPHEVSSLAALLSKVLVCYDNLFKTSCPYSFGWYQTPLQFSKPEEKRHWQLHGLFLPPLLRSATVKKFMVGYELLAESQRDLTPEKAAEMLRSAAGVHYLKAGHL